MDLSLHITHYRLREPPSFSSPLRALSAKQPSAFVTIAAGLLQPVGFRNDKDAVFARSLDRSNPVSLLLLLDCFTPLAFAMTKNYVSIPITVFASRVAAWRSSAFATLAAGLLHACWRIAMTKMLSLQSDLSLRGGRRLIKYTVFAST